MILIIQCYITAAVNSLYRFYPIILGLSIFSCVLGNLCEKRKQETRRLLVETLSSSIPLQRKESQKQLVGKEKDTQQQLADEERHVVEMLSRNFWTDEHLRTLTDCIEKKVAPNTIRWGVATKNNQQQVESSRVFSTPFQRMWNKFVHAVQKEHEWLAPYTITGNERFFTVPSRVLLLSVILLTQLFTEALFFDYRFSTTRGTCSVETVYSTNVNVTSWTVNGTVVESRYDKQFFILIVLPVSLLSFIVCVFTSCYSCLPLFFFGIYHLPATTQPLTPKRRPATLKIHRD